MNTTAGKSDGILTFQDFEAMNDPAAGASKAMQLHRKAKMFQIALWADEYDAQRNTTINEYVQKLFDVTGSKLVDYTASNNKLSSNFFNRLNTQRCMYSLGNGVTFVDSSGADLGKGADMFGGDFDRDIQRAAYLGLIHGVSFVFLDVDKVHVFPLTQFAPIWDERDGTLRAGVRFWRLSKSRPWQAVLYEREGYTKLEGTADDNDGLRVVEDRRPYGVKLATVPADGPGCERVVGELAYSGLPIVPLWGSRLHQSTLVGMREAIDSYDLVRSGFANDLSDCAQVYWILRGYGGMNDADLQRFVDRIKLTHVAKADETIGTDAGITPYTQEIPYQARKEFLDGIRAGIYEDFGGLDVHTIAAGSTNDHIDAAYQPLDEQASDFERQVSDCVRQLLVLRGLDDAQPVYKRQRISNQREQVEMLAIEAQWLDEDTILAKLPNVSPSEVEGIVKRREEEDRLRMPVAADTEPVEVVEEV